MEFVEKRWGGEVIFADEAEYAGKLLRFDKENAKFSMHYHMIKKETWYVLDGVFKLNLIDTKNASRRSFVMKPGDTWINLPGQPHQLECLSSHGTILEVSTHDDPEDNYRIEPGDSQCF